MEALESSLDPLIKDAVGYAPKAFLALITLIIGLWLVRIVTHVLGRMLGVRHVDKSLATFLTSLTGWTLRVLLFISVASTIGIETTSFVAVMGAAGLAVGMAPSPRTTAG